MAANLPEEFQDNYDNYGDTFFEVARLLMENHGSQYTQSEIAEVVGVTQSRVSDFTSKLEKDGWLNRHDGDLTFVWNTRQHNPVEMKASDAVFGLYRDLWSVFRKHISTSTGVFAVFGSFFFVTSAVMLFSYVLTRLAGSEIPPPLFFGIGLGSAVTGLIITAISPLQAFVNRGIERLLRSR